MQQTRRPDPAWRKSLHLYLPATVTTTDPPFHYQPPAEGPTVLWEDEALLVFVKPSGLLSVPGRAVHHRDCALSRLQAIHGPLWVVHRLDMDTSGVMVMARSAATAGALGRQFERREVGKRYQAWVWGRVQQTAGTIALPLAVDWPHRPRQQVDWSRGKPSTTGYEVLRRLPSRSLLALSPHTGRSHQLRVHLAAIGHPICGDRFYGLRREPGSHPEGEATAEGMAASASAEQPPGPPDPSRLALHADRLALRHPLTGNWHTWESPPEWCLT